MSVEASLYSPSVDGIPNQRVSIELNTGFHAVNMTKVPTTPTERSDVEQRFADLYERERRHMDNGGLVVHIMEIANFTEAMAAQLYQLCDQGILPSEAAKRVLVASTFVNPAEQLPVDHMAKSVQEFNDIHWKMVDMLAQSYPQQFKFRVENGTEEAVRETMAAYRDGQQVLIDMKAGNMNVAAYKETSRRSYQTLSPRNIGYAEQVAAITNKNANTDLFVAVVVGSGHAGDISHELLMRGMIVDTVNPDGSVSNLPAIWSTSALLRKGEAATDLEWKQDMLIAAISDSPLVGGTYEEAMIIVKLLVMKYLRTDEAIDAFMREVRENVMSEMEKGKDKHSGWILTLTKYYKQLVTDLFQGK